MLKLSWYHKIPPANDVLEHETEHPRPDGIRMGEISVDLERVTTGEARVRGLVLLLNAEARLLAEYGSKAMLKEGPIKQAAQTLAFARTGVATAYIRETAAEYKGITAMALEAEMHAANVACVEELLGRPDQDHVPANPIRPHRDDTPTPKEVQEMDKADQIVRMALGENT